MADAALNETSYGYTEEERAHLLTDQVNLIGSTTTTGLAFGVVLTLYLICLNTLVKDLRTDRRKTAVIGIAYTTVMFLLGALYCASNARTTQEAYVDNKGFPGGPNAYANFIFDQPITIAGLVAFFGANWMTDAILIWRLSVLYRGSRYLWAVLFMPCLMYLTSFSMSIVTIVQSSQPTQSFYATAVVPFSYAYYSISVSMTVLATSLMVGKIWMVRRKYQSVMGDSPHTAQYVSIAAMLVESSALYTIWSCIFLGLYVQGHPVMYIFLGTLAEVQIIAPMMIILLVAQGKAWNQSTEANLSTAWSTGRSRTTGLGSATTASAPSHLEKGFPLNSLSKKESTESYN